MVGVDAWAIDTQLAVDQRQVKGVVEFLVTGHGWCIGPAGALAIDLEVLGVHLEREHGLEPG